MYHRWSAKFNEILNGKSCCWHLFLHLWNIRAFQVFAAQISIDRVTQWLIPFNDDDSRPHLLRNKQDYSQTLSLHVIILAFSVRSMWCWFRCRLCSCFGMQCMHSMGKYEFHSCLCPCPVNVWGNEYDSGEASIVFTHTSDRHKSNWNDTPRPHLSRW